MATLTRVASEPRPFTPEPITDEEAAAMFRATLNLFRLWSVNDDQAATILDVPRRTFARARSPSTTGRASGIPTLPRTAPRSFRATALSGSRSSPATASCCSAISVSLCSDSTGPDYG